MDTNFLFDNENIPKSTLYVSTNIYNLDNYIINEDMLDFYNCRINLNESNELIYILLNKGLSPYP